MNQALVERQTSISAELQEKVLLGGDLSRLSATERLSYYNAVCQSVGLNPLTRPFEYLILNGKMVLYARKDCTDQLRDQHGISVQISSRELVDGVYVVTAAAKNMTERTDESIGAVPLPTAPLDKANAMMKAETKAKRRVTLSICGLGMLDETEVETIHGAKVVQTLSEGTPEPTRTEIEHQPNELEQQLQASIEAQQEKAPSTDDPSAPYRAKINTAHTWQAVNKCYADTPETLKQDVFPDYQAKLKELGEKKK